MDYDAEFCRCRSRDLGFSVGSFEILALDTNFSDHLPLLISVPVETRPSLRWVIMPNLVVANGIGVHGGP